MAPPDERAPRLRYRLGVFLAPLDLAAGLLAGPRIARRYRGDARAVMILPGFLMTDQTTWPLRRALARAGYRVEGWGIGASLGVTAERLQQAEAAVRDLARRTGGPVALVGWSLGGLYAREIAKRAPDVVDRVVTLGSPFSGSRRANHAWRLYERVAGHSVDAIPIEADTAVKPPALTIALWSPIDGMVAPASARGRPGEADDAVEVRCRHTGFVLAPRAIKAVLEALARPVERP